MANFLIETNFILFQIKSNQFLQKKKKCPKLNGSLVFLLSFFSSINVMSSLSLRKHTFLIELIRSITYGLMCSLCPSIRSNLYQVIRIQLGDNFSEVSDFRFLYAL